MCYCPMDEDDGSGRIDAVVPWMGDAVTTALLVVWWVELNQPTVRGEPLFEVGTDKTVFEVAAEVDGVLSEVLVPGGEPVTPGMVVGRIRPL
jgi:pyruvate/2-oxoglutarate dehydrogenase complex dihydrolipoamide acyltransferase (E2) component